MNDATTIDLDRIAWRLKYGMDVPKAFPGSDRHRGRMTTKRACELARQRPGFTR